MAALLIMLAVMAILMTVAMPVWRHQAQREKEAELVFRGEQYARAIALYRAKNAQIPNALPPSIDVLVEGRFLRKKYKDPMTKDGEFALIQMATQNQPGIPPPANPQSPTTPPTIPGSSLPPVAGGRGGLPQPGQGSGPLSVGGIQGVRSKSTETSIRSYRGQTRYDQWAFTFNIAPIPGGALPLANSGEGGRGTDPSNPFPGVGGRGRGPGGGPNRGGGPGRGGGTNRGGGPGTGGTPGQTITPGGNFPPPPPAPGGRPGGPGRGGGQ